MLKVRIKKILVPIDGSKNSFKGLNQAIYLARQCGATVDEKIGINESELKLLNTSAVIIKNNIKKI